MPTPAYAKGRLYTGNDTGIFSCLDAVTGDVLWKKDLAKDFKARIPRYGASAAPLVEGDLLDHASLIAALELTQPDELYNLGAISFVPLSWKQALLTGEITGLGVLENPVKDA